jgi:hypothetical protein
MKEDSQLIKQIKQMLIAEVAFYRMFLKDLSA